MNQGIKGNRFYNWYAGNHCHPKCPAKKVLLCKVEIEKRLKENLIASHKDFIRLVRRQFQICDLSEAEYARNVYREPICHHALHMKLNEMTDKEKRTFHIIEELTLLLMWLTRWSDQKLEGQTLWRAWKGYDFPALDSLLEKEYISFSYTAKSIHFRDKGVEKVKELLCKYHLAP